MVFGFLPATAIPCFFFCTPLVYRITRTCFYLLTFLPLPGSLSALPFSTTSWFFSTPPCTRLPALPPPTAFMPYLPLLHFLLLPRSYTALRATARTPPFRTRLRSFSAHLRATACGLLCCLGSWVLPPATHTCTCVHVLSAPHTHAHAAAPRLITPVRLHRQFFATHYPGSPLPRLPATWVPHWLPRACYARTFFAACRTSPAFSTLHQFPFAVRWFVTC